MSWVGLLTDLTRQKNPLGKKKLIKGLKKSKISGPRENKSPDQNPTKGLLATPSSPSNKATR